MIRNYVNFGFVVVGGFCWYMAWRAEAKRRALFEQAQRLMESRQVGTAWTDAEKGESVTVTLGRNDYDFHLNNGSPVLYHRERNR